MWFLDSIAGYVIASYAKADLSLSESILQIIMLPNKANYLMISIQIIGNDVILKSNSHSIKSSSSIYRYLVFSSSENFHETKL